MFALPNELKLHIFSYLPPVDVLRFHRLNRHFKRLTEEHPLDFKKLCITVVVRPSGRPSDKDRMDVEIRTPVQIFRCDIVRKTDDKPRVAVKGYDERTRKFFKDWQKRRDDDDDLCYYFGWLFTIGNVKLEVHLNLDPSVHTGLMNALGETTTQIKKFTMNIESLESHFEAEDVVKYMQLCSRNGTPEVNVKVDGMSPYYYNSYDAMKNYSRIAQVFPQFCLDLKLEQVCSAIGHFVDAWREHPDYTVNFKLRFHGGGGCAYENRCFFRRLPGTHNIPRPFRKNHIAKNIPNEITLEIPGQTNLRMTFTKGTGKFYISTIHFDD